MTIGELAGRSGLAVSAIRFYQRRGLLPPRDSGSAWQRYDDATLARLAVIELAKRTGFTLDEIAVLLSTADTSTAPGGAWKTMLSAKLDEISTQVQQLHAMSQLLTEALRCECLTLDRAGAIPAALGWATGTAVASRAPVTVAPVR